MVFTNFIKSIYEEYKGVLITLVIFVCLISFIKKETVPYHDESALEFRNLNLEEQKLFLITQFNTTINREMIPQQETYIKKFYSQIYGKEESKMYSKKHTSNTSASISPKKKGVKVRFNDILEISRN